jgi:hypothetical protein
VLSNVGEFHVARLPGSFVEPVQLGLDEQHLVKDCLAADA